MLNKIQNFFFDLQEKDEETKKWWLAILTSGSMLMVVSLWIGYINLTVKNLGDKDDRAQQASFFQTFGSGLNIVSGKLAGELKELFNKKNSVVIETQPANLNFVVKKDLEPIKPKKLP